MKVEGRKETKYAGRDEKKEKILDQKREPKKNWPVGQWRMEGRVGGRFPRLKGKVRPRDPEVIQLRNGEG